MPPTHVLDASAVLKLILDEESSDAMRAWFRSALAVRGRFLAPSLIPYELLHALWRNAPEAPGPTWSRDAIRDALAAVELDPDAWARADVWRGVLSGYDAAYLALARATEAVLVTYDDRLASEARRHVAVLAPGRPDLGSPGRAT